MRGCISTAIVDIYKPTKQPQVEVIGHSTTPAIHMIKFGPLIANRGPFQDPCEPFDIAQDKPVEASPPARVCVKRPEFSKSTGQYCTFRVISGFILRIGLKFTLFSV
jgi:hypothetical protein